METVIPQWAPEWVGYSPTFKEPTAQGRDNTDDDKMKVLGSKSAWATIVSLTSVTSVVLRISANRY